MSFALFLTTNVFGQKNRPTVKKVVKGSKVKKSAGYQTSSEDLQQFRQKKSVKVKSKKSAGFQTSSEDLRELKSSRKRKTKKRL